MSQLAIKGHNTRGKEVIKLLEMLGGNDINTYRGHSEDLVYFINSDYYGSIGRDTINSNYYDSYNIYSLEDFLEKFPYKVGDKVSSKYLKNYKIEKMEWEDTNNSVIYKLQGMGWYSANELQPYKEEIMEEEKIEVFEILESNCKDEVKIEFDTSKFEMVERENGYYVVRKKPQYPKTYEECCKTLKIPANGVIVFEEKSCMENDYITQHLELLRAFSKIFICRKAYWKIAGEEMGLGKSWEPDWKDCTKIKYTIHLPEYRWLSFPTSEMRDAFYENFKDLIQICKEFIVI